MRQFARTYEQGTEEWEQRERIFYKRLKEVIDFHSGPPKTWAMGITKFMDFTEQEFRAMLGYRGQRKKTSPRTAASLLSMDEREKRASVPLPKSVNTLQASSKLALVIRDQGGCGSCWAEAAVEVLEARLESNRTLVEGLKAKAKTFGKKLLVPTLSTQAVVSCAPNPRHCGGSGACGGATAELAYKLIKERGVPFALSWAYKSSNGVAPSCMETVFDKSVVGIGGWTVLPSNRVNPLKQALIENPGPVVVTAAAEGWAYYEKGIYSDITARSQEGDFTVNHAVVLVGYKDPDPAKQELGYWIIKNSWGESWGENGYIRLEMKLNEEQHCGWDYSPQEGVACEGDPDKAWVCGTCGILYDSTYPTGIHIKK